MLSCTVAGDTEEVIYGSFQSGNRRSKCLTLLPPLPCCHPCRDAAKEIQCKLEYTTLSKIIACSEIW